MKNGGTFMSPSAISNGNAMKITLGSSRIAIITFNWSGTPQTIFIFKEGSKVYGEGYAIESQIVFKKLDGARWEIAHASGNALDGFMYFPMFGTLSAEEVQKTGDYSAVSPL